MEAEERHWAYIRGGGASDGIKEAIVRSSEPSVGELLKLYFEKHTSLKAESSRATEKLRLTKTIPETWLYFGARPPDTNLFKGGFKTLETLGHYYVRFGDLRVSACGKAAVMDYIARREKAGRKGETIRRELVLISSAFERVSELCAGFEAKNPVSMLRDEEKPEHGEPRDRVLDVEEEKALLKAADEYENPEGALAFRLALGTAMRRGDLFNLNWKDVDWHERTIGLAAHKAAAAAKTKGRKPKRRTVFLLPVAFAALAEAWERADNPSEGTVFTYAQDGLKTAIRRIIERSGIEDFSFHDLRHTVLTRLALAGWTPLQVSKTQDVSDAKHLQDRVFSKPRAREIHKKLEGGETLSSEDLMTVSGHSSIQMLGAYANIRAGDAAIAPEASAAKPASLRVAPTTDGWFVASTVAADGSLVEAVGATAKEAKALLKELLDD